MASIGDAFRKGEIWESPRGTLCRVESVEGRLACLRAGTVGRGRLVRRAWDDVLGWTRPPELNGDAGSDAQQN